jgi:hypothetical protein
VTGVPDNVVTSRRSDLPMAELEMDVHLRRLLKRTSVMRQGFYFVVLLVALAGQVSGAVETLRIPLVAAVPAVGALELGGIVVLANADVRRRLGERAVASRLLSVAIAAGAVAFNWLAHANHLLGGFFAGMSALGYLVWLMHTENQRRDRLRAKGDLPPTTPAYEMVDHWLRHPWLTHRAKSMAKSDPGLGLYDSLSAARAELRRERRQAAISKVLHRKIRAAVDPNTADIAVAVYDLDEIATRLADGADYDGLTALIAADLAPARLGLDVSALPTGAGAGAPHLPAPDEGTPPEESTGGQAATGVPAAPAGAAGTATTVPVPVPASGIDSPTMESPIVRGSAADGPAPLVARSVPVPVLDPLTRRSLEELGFGRQPEPAVLGTPDEPARRDRTRRVAGTQRATTSTTATSTGAATAAVAAPVPATGPLSDTLPPPAPSGAVRTSSRPLAGPPAGGEGSLRTRVHAALDALVPAGDQRDETELLNLVADELALGDVDRFAAGPYVRSWSQEYSRLAVPAGGAGPLSVGRSVAG